MSYWIWSTSFNRTYALLGRIRIYRRMATRFLLLLCGLTRNGTVDYCYYYYYSVDSVWFLHVRFVHMFHTHFMWNCEPTTAHKITCSINNYVSCWSRVDCRQCKHTKREYQMKWANKKRNIDKSCHYSIRHKQHLMAHSSSCAFRRLLFLRHCRSYFFDLRC